MKGYCSWAFVAQVWDSHSHHTSMPSDLLALTKPVAILWAASGSEAWEGKPPRNWGSLSNSLWGTGSCQQPQGWSWKLIFPCKLWDVPCPRGDLDCSLEGLWPSHDWIPDLQTREDGQCCFRSLKLATQQ